MAFGLKMEHIDKLEQGILIYSYCSIFRKLLSSSTAIYISTALFQLDFSNLYIILYNSSNERTCYHIDIT